MGRSKTANHGSDFQNLSGDALNVIYEELRTSHEAATDLNKRLRDETQQTLSIAAIVISISIGLSAPTNDASRIMFVVAVVLLVATVLASFVFLFNQPPARTMDMASFLGGQKEKVTLDSLRRHRVTRALAVNEASHILLRQRVLQVNLIKAGLAASVVFLGVGFLVGLI